MKKSIKTRIISIATAALMTLSVATATMASASAATVDGTSVSAYQNALYGAYFFNENTGDSAWAKVDCRGYMGDSVTISGDYTHVIFVRINPETGKLSFDKGNAWNKTADLRISDLNGVYTINGWELEVE